MGQSTSTGGTFEFRVSMADLLTKPIDPTDTLFWNTLWKTPQTALDIFQYVGPKEVRRLIQDQPTNLKTLVSQAISHMSVFVHQPDHEHHTQALNCVRFLTRILPFLFETMKEDDGALMHDVFWRVPSTTPTTAPTSPFTATATTTAAGQTKETTAHPPAATAGVTAATTAASKTDTDSTPHVCLARQMIGAMMKMLFLPDFTIDLERFTALCRPPPKNDIEVGTGTGAAGAGRVAVGAVEAIDNSYPEANPGHIWEYGIGVSAASQAAFGVWGANARLELNRTEVLKLLVTCMCRPLYVVPEQHPVYNDQWMQAICEDEHDLQR